MYRNILVPIDPGHGDVVDRIVAVARHLAGADGQITLLTVVEPVPAYVANHIPRATLDASRAEARQRLADAGTAAGLAEPRIEVVEGPPIRTILETAERIGADAIVLGSHRPDFRDYLIGSTAARVVSHANCTVVVERSAI